MIEMRKKAAAVLSGILLLSLLLVICFPFWRHLTPLLTAYVFPVAYPEFSSGFGKRKHPIYRVVRNHSGVDLAAPLGAPIRAISKGVIIFADPLNGYGNFVVVKHAGRITSHYGHCHKIRVKIGQQVAAGEIIATVGSSGDSTGPHLHFELRQDGTPMDPVKYLPGLKAKAAG